MMIYQWIALYDGTGFTDLAQLYIIIRGVN